MEASSKLSGTTGQVVAARKAGTPCKELSLRNIVKFVNFYNIPIDIIGIQWYSIIII